MLVHVVCGIQWHTRMANVEWSELMQSWVNRGGWKGGGSESSEMRASERTSELKGSRRRCETDGGRWGMRNCLKNRPCCISNLFVVIHSPNGFWSECKERSDWLKPIAYTYISQAAFYNAILCSLVSIRVLCKYTMWALLLYSYVFCVHVVNIRGKKEMSFNSMHFPGSV